MKSRKFGKLQLIVMSGVILTPVPMALSCGTPKQNGSFDDVTKDQTKNDLAQEKKIASSIDNDTSITFKVRTEDVDLWKPIVDKFNTHQKGKVTVSPSAFTSPDLIPTIETASATGDLEDLVITDMNVIAKAIRNNSWFKPIDLADIFAEANQDIYDVLDSNTSGDDVLFEPHVKLNSNANQVSMAMPIGFGGRNLFMNTTMLDNNKTIISYAPLEGGASGTTIPGKFGLEEVGEFPRESGESLNDYVQRYLGEAGNKDAASSQLSADHPNWLGYGPGNMFQRMFSIAFSLLKNPAKTAGVYAMAFKENISNYGLYATSVEGIYDLEDGILKQNDFEKNIVKDDFAKYLWNAFGAYMFPQGGGFMTSNKITHSPNLGEVEPFRDKQTLFTFNAKWGGKMANDGWSQKGAQNSWTDPLLSYEDTKGYESGQIYPLIAPYADVGIADSISLKKDLSPEKSVVAKRFLKYLSNLDEQELVTIVSGGVEVPNLTIGEASAYKFISSINAVREQQSTSSSAGLENTFKLGLKNATDPSDEIKGIGGTVWQKTDTDYLDIFSVKLRDNLQTYYGASTSTVEQWTYEQFKAKVNEGIKAYQDQMALT